MGQEMSDVTGYEGGWVEGSPSHHTPATTFDINEDYPALDSVVRLAKVRAGLDPDLAHPVRDYCNFIPKPYQSAFWDRVLTLTFEAMVAEVEK